MTDRIEAQENLSHVEMHEASNGSLMLRATIARDVITTVPGKRLRQAGVQGVRDGKKYKVYRSAEALFNTETMRSFEQAMLRLGHDNPTVVGAPVGPVQKANEAGLGLRYNVFGREAIEQYKSGRARELSPGYSFIPMPAPHGADYDFTMAQIEVDHVAQVPRGQNGPSIRLMEHKEESEMGEKVELSEESVKSLGQVLVDGLKGLFTKSDDGNPDGDKNKPVKTQEEYQARLDGMEQAYKDRTLVAPLLKSDRAKKRIATSTDSVEILGIALGVREAEAMERGADVLRGQVMERVSMVERKSNEESWENFNSEEAKPNADTSKVVDVFESQHRKRAEAIRTGNPVVINHINSQDA